jgi:6-pyruvoyltetrahydropterin/6-carboxytetrahydropterin synthase
VTTLTRRYSFSASHRLHSAALSSAENVEIFGKCNNPFGHGHDYVLEVTVAGESDPISGLIVPVPQLDRLVAEKILRLFRNCNINLDIAEFANLVATTENVTRVVANLLEREWRECMGKFQARLAKVRVEETARNSCEICLN